MKTLKIYVLLTALLLLGGWKMQAQQPYDLEEIFVTDEAIPVYVQYTNTDEMIVFTTNGEKFQFIKMRENGDIIDAVDYPFASGTKTYLLSRFMRLPDHKYLQFYYETVGDSTTFHAIQIDDNLQMTVKDYGGKMGDFMLINDRQNILTRAVVCKDGSAFIAYAPDSLFLAYYNGSQVMSGVRIMKFGPDGELVGDRVFKDLIGGGFHHWCEPTPDSLRCRLIVQEKDDKGSYHGIHLNGYVLDSELNTVLKRENITGLIYPAMMMDPDSYHSNPYNGKMYAIGSVSCPYPQLIDDEVVMSVMDENFVEENYTWGMHRLVDCQGAQQNAIAFSESGDVYMLAHMDFKASIDICNNFYLAWLDEALNKKGEIYYHNETRGVYPLSVHACPNGGCLVMCIGYNRENSSMENVIYKVSQGILDDIEEAHDAGFAVAVAYPNPGKDVLNIRTALENARVEVYDLNGRLMDSQKITENVTTIDAEAWPSGMYVWKVYTGVSAGSTTLAETGKWVKE